MSRKILLKRNPIRPRAHGGRIARTAEELYKHSDPTITDSELDAWLKKLRAMRKGKA